VVGLAPLHVSCRQDQLNRQVSQQSPHGLNSGDEIVRFLEKGKIGNNHLMMAILLENMAKTFNLSSCFLWKRPTQN